MSIHISILPLNVNIALFYKILRPFHYLTLYFILFKTADHLFVSSS